ncbi:homeobox protein ARX-like [Aquila chrysaetos chrysaetos]|uniref:homeobox protein ARX-like n=1 Tax=Aquila chrysaetos chrysaetos TaxID=223781 RepID=UPI00117726EB|nr:homeobox protein ARX-like [Aquila chrysaetos chrysaetos]
MAAPLHAATPPVTPASRPRGAGRGVTRLRSVRSAGLQSRRRARSRRLESGAAVGRRGGPGRPRDEPSLAWSGGHPLRLPARAAGCAARRTKAATSPEAKRGGAARRAEPSLRRAPRPCVSATEAAAAAAAAPAGGFLGAVAGLCGEGAAAPPPPPPLARHGQRQVGGRGSPAAAGGRAA